MTVRRTLHGMGFGYRLHRRDLPNTPDIVLSRWKAVIPINGCFFHGRPELQDAVQQLRVLAREDTSKQGTGRGDGRGPHVR
jgi:DNA mismatch endonuclease Vsr